MSVEALVNDVLALPPQARLEVLERVWEIIHHSPGSIPMSAARAAELDRRSADMDANPDDESDVEDVIARLRGEQ
jgi:putative addiction module component (TIGR02574 family)